MVEIFHIFMGMLVNAKIKNCENSLKITLTHFQDCQTNFK